METFVPQITLLDCPPSTSASDVLGLRLEKVAASDPASGIGTPFSSTRSRRRRPLLGSRMSELMSCLLFRASVVPAASGDRTNKRVELVRSGRRSFSGPAASELVA